MYTDNGNFTNAEIEFRNAVNGVLTGITTNVTTVTTIIENIVVLAGKNYEDLFDPSPWTTDGPVVPSIMCNPFGAALRMGGDYRYLNYSIRYNRDRFDRFIRDFMNTKITAQDRMYEASCWEVLARDPNKDPIKYSNRIKGVTFNQNNPRLTTYPKRGYFSELSQVAPIDPNIPKIQLVRNALNPPSRSALNIKWISQQQAKYLAMILIIDRSGSMMLGDKLSKAITAAKNLISLAEVGKTSIEVIAFSSTVQVIYPFTYIADQSVKNEIISAIDNITAGGSTAIGDAMQEAMDDFLAETSDVENRTLYLLTDGINNVGENPDAILSSYVDNSIPVYTFAYGEDSDKDLLRRIADYTKGKFYYLLTYLADIILAFNDAIKEILPSQGIGSLSDNLASYSAKNYNFSVDFTSSKLTVTLFFNGALGDLYTELKDPDGTIYTNCECSESGSEAFCVYTCDNPRVGRWEMMVNSLTSNPLKVTYDIVSASKDVIPYSLSVTNLTGTLVQYPEPFLLEAVFRKDLPIAGAVVSGALEFPDGTVCQLNFRDDGLAPDYIGNDGRYSAIFTDYSMNGIYKVIVSANNSLKTARMTYQGLQRSIALDGSTPEPPPDIPIDEEVERIYTIQITVQGVVDDDNDDDFLSAMEILADNAAHPGKIEVPGDIDFFKVIIPDSDVSEVAFRVFDLGPAMLPILAIYDEDKVSLGENTYGSSNYPLIKVNPNGKNIFYASIKHSDPTGTGTYYFSAGTTITSDIIIEEQQPTTKAISNKGWDYCFCYPNFYWNNICWNNGYWISCSNFCWNNNYWMNNYSDMLTTYNLWGKWSNSYYNQHPSYNLMNNYSDMLTTYNLWGKWSNSYYNQHPSYNLWNIFGLSYYDWYLNLLENNNYFDQYNQYLNLISYNRL